VEQFPENKGLAPYHDRIPLNPDRDT